jgi:hypothetical protein
MKYLISENPVKSLFLFIILANPFIALAEEDNGSSALQAREFLTPDKMTKEDYEMLNGYSTSYNQCLTETSIKQMEAQSDPRIVVDFAMKFCAVQLEELNKKMIDRNYDPNFRQGYIHRISNKGANNTLRVMMMGMAAKQSQQQTLQDTVEE